MLDRCNRTVSLLFGCLACLVVTSVVNADGRVFVLDLRNSSGLQGFRDAEWACASRHARLASSAELRHAVVECFFSQCTRGWLYGGTVGTTVCDAVGSAPKAVDVRTENATVDAAHLDAFCIKDKGVPCGDPPSFPNARLQEHSGYDMGDELLYTCVPSYVMPSGRSAFSLLCDSCGEWYGLVEICVKDQTESHIDYEDKFPEFYGEAEPHSDRPVEANGEVYEEVHGAANPDRKMSQEQQETSFSDEAEEAHQDQHGEHDVGREKKFEGAVEGGEKEEERAVEDFVGHPVWVQERREMATADAAAGTDAPVSILSQKHLFWFPSEAFQDEGRPVSINPVTQTSQRASGAQSEESKENESQETHHYQHPVDVVDHDHDHDPEPDRYDDHDTDGSDDRDDSHHEDPDDRDSHQDKDDHDDHVKQYIPAPRDDLDRRDSHDSYDDHDDHDDHYDMGEHEEERARDRVRYGSQEYDERDDTYDEHESYEDHEDVSENHGDDVIERHDSSKEQPDHSDQDDHVDHVDHDDHDDHVDHDDHDDHDLEVDGNDRYTDHHDHDDHGDHEHDDHDHDDHDHDDHDHDDHDHNDHDIYDDHDSHENVDEGHQHVILSIARDDSQNVTQREEGVKATTDDTWLDGYPVVQAEADNGDSATGRVSPEDRERGTVVRITDRPNEVEIRKPVPNTSLPEVPESTTTEPAVEQGGVEEIWPDFIPTTAPSPERSQPSDSDTKQAAPTHSWLDDLTEHPFLDHDAAPPIDDGERLGEEHTVQNLPGEIGERGEMEGEIGETICTGESCPPPSSSSRGPTVAAITVLVCAVAAAVIIGVWCYRRQQQKSSMYEMNGKGQSQTRQGQQIEMQQKV